MKPPTYKHTSYDISHIQQLWYLPHTDISHLSSSPAICGWSGLEWVASNLKAFLRFQSPPPPPPHPHTHNQSCKTQWGQPSAPPAPTRSLRVYQRESYQWSGRPAILYTLRNTDGFQDWPPTLLEKERINACCLSNFQKNLLFKICWGKESGLRFVLYIIFFYSASWNRIIVLTVLAPHHGKNFINEKD
jgi:hypothetical protein